MHCLLRLARRERQRPRRGLVVGARGRCFILGRVVDRHGPRRRAGQRHREVDRVVAPFPGTAAGHLQRRRAWNRRRHRVRQRADVRRAHCARVVAVPTACQRHSDVPPRARLHLHAPQPGVGLFDLPHPAPRHVERRLARRLAEVPDRLAQPHQEAELLLAVVLRGHLFERRRQLVFRVGVGVPAAADLHAVRRRRGFDCVGPHTRHPHPVARMGPDFVRCRRRSAREPAHRDCLRRVQAGTVRRGCSSSCTSPTDRTSWSPPGCSPSPGRCPRRRMTR